MSYWQEIVGDTFYWRALYIYAEHADNLIYLSLSTCMFWAAQDGR